MIWPFSRPAPAVQALPTPAPDRPIWAIGDIHGCVDQLDALLTAITAQGGRAETLICLGDYADRGPDSAGVLARLQALDADTTRETVFLMGNHDRMLLDFLLDPSGAGPRFLGNGGQETLLSFGVLPATCGPASDRLHSQADALAEAMGPLRDWLARRPLWHGSGNCLFVHAQTDPALPMEEQAQDVLLWARPPRRIIPRDDGAWVIHGHTIVPEPRTEAGHIAIDTGAYRGGPLTAIRLAPGEEPRILQS